MAELRVASWNKLGAGSWKRAGSWNSVSHELRAAVLRPRISWGDTSWTASWKIFTNILKNRNK